ncbi:MAG: ribonuclease PH [Verrucomicrobiota bacterium]
MRKRQGDRAYNELREIKFQPGIAPHADGSVLVSFGDTQVICSAMIEERVPRWMQVQNVAGGWLTAEYSMLPYSTLERKSRDVRRGQQDGRSIEIQRLIGRSLRAVVDLKKLGSRTLWVDCDVLRADGGTRTAAITGGCVACAIAFHKLVEKNKIKASPLRQFVSAVSTGVVDHQCLLDLCYEEDRDASVDFNVVMTEQGEFVEVQGSGEEAVFSQEQLTELLDLAKNGVQGLLEHQHQALREALPKANADELADLSDHFGG